MGFFSLGAAGQLGFYRSLRENIRGDEEYDREMDKIKQKADKATKAAANFMSKQDALKRNRETLLKVIGQDETLSKRFSGIDPKAMDNFLRAAQNTYQSTLSPDNAIRFFSGATPEQVKSYISDETSEAPTITVEPEERSTGEKIARGMAAFLSPSARLEQARERSGVKPEGVTDEQWQQIQAGETPSIYDPPERPVVMPDVMDQTEKKLTSGLVQQISAAPEFRDKTRGGVSLTKSAAEAKQILLQEARLGNTALFGNLINEVEPDKIMREIFIKLDQLLQMGDLSKEERDQISASGELAIDRLLEDKAGTSDKSSGTNTPPASVPSSAATTPTQNVLKEQYESGNRMYQGKKIIRYGDPTNPKVPYTYKLQD